MHHPLPSFTFPCCRTSTLVALALAENIRVLLKWRAVELALSPQVGGQEAVCVGDGNEGGLEGVLEGLGRTRGGGVDVVYTSQLQQALDSWGGDQAGTTRGRDELEHISICKMCEA